MPRCQLYNFSHNICPWKDKCSRLYICTCIYVHACLSGTIYGAYPTTLYFSIHMQVLNDGCIDPIHRPCPFPLHCSPLCVALSKGSILIIVILSSVMTVLTVTNKSMQLMAFRLPYSKIDATILDAHKVNKVQPHL